MKNIIEVTTPVYCKSLLEAHLLRCGMDCSVYATEYPPYVTRILFKYEQDMIIFVLRGIPYMHKEVPALADANSQFDLLLEQHLDTLGM